MARANFKLTISREAHDFLKKEAKRKYTSVNSLLQQWLDDPPRRRKVIPDKVDYTCRFVDGAAVKIRRASELLGVTKSGLMRLLVDYHRQNASKKSRRGKQDDQPSR